MDAQTIMLAIVGPVILWLLSDIRRSVARVAVQLRDLEARVVSHEIAIAHLRWQADATNVRVPQCE